MHRRLAPLLAVALAATAFTAPPTPQDECDVVPELGPRACATLDAGGVVAAGACDEVGGPPASCGTTRGVVVDPALVDAWEASPLATLHALQRDLGAVLPLGRAQVLASHNSYNAQAYGAAVANQDPNQWYSLTDQLRMEMRALELDVHTWVGPEGDGRLPVLCHGTGPHLGCSTDRPLADGVAELRAWLDAHPDEVVLLDVEDHLDGVEGHDEAAAVLEEHLGDVLLRPPADQPCAPMPLERSLADIRDQGAQVLLVSSCGEGAAWPALAHAYGDWHQGRLGSFDAEDCGPDFDRATYDTGWTRYWEDTTWLSAMASGPGPRLDAETTRAVLACGLSQPSFDRLHPDDERLRATLWSWAEDERPMAAPVGSRAVLAPDGRLRVANDAAAVLCRTSAGDVTVLPLSGSVDDVCGDGALTVPRSAREMHLANEAAAAALGDGRTVAVLVALTRTEDGWD